MTRKFSILTAIAAPLVLDNIDTDKILAAAYLKTVSREGLGRALFSSMRYDAEGGERADFILNKGPWRQAGILIAGENFGCGSSREHAPWALKDFGISCIIAPSFADIFYANCFKNGILPIHMDGEDFELLVKMGRDETSAVFTVNLPEQTITLIDGSMICFSMDPDSKASLILGRNEITETLKYLPDVQAWEQKKPKQIKGFSQSIVDI